MRSGRHIRRWAALPGGRSARRTRLGAGPAASTRRVREAEAGAAVSMKYEVRSTKTGRPRLLEPVVALRTSYFVLRTCQRPVSLLLTLAQRFGLDGEIGQKLFHLLVVLRRVHGALHQPQRGN